LVLERLRKDKLIFEEFKVIDDYEKFLIQNKIHEDIVKRDLRKEIREEVKAEVKGEIREEVKAEVKGEIREEVKAEVKGEIREEVKAEVKGEIREEVKDEIKQELREEMIEIKNQEFVIAGYLKGLKNDFIAELTNLPIDKIEDFIKKYEEEKKKY
jgi:NADH:ubiquinone oxidoreductase subunit E